MPTYRLYGLDVSVDRPLLGIEPAAALEHADVEVSTVEAVPAEEMLPEPVEWTLRDSFYTHFRLERGEGASGTYVRLHYVDNPHAVTFVIGPDGRRIWVRWSEGTPFHDVNTLLQGPVLGRTLRMRGTQVLHAGALAVEGQAFCLVGTKGAGKSTTTAAFARLGYPVITDDLAALELTDEGTLVHPGLARVRLRSDAAQGLEGTRPDLTPIWSKDYPNQKYYLDLQDEAAGITEPLPLAAVFSLGPRTPEGTPHIEPVPQAAALLELVTHSYASSILKPEQRAHEFAALGRVAARVPLRRVYRGEGVNTLPETCEAILRDLDRLPRSVS